MVIVTIARVVLVKTENALLWILLKIPLVDIEKMFERREKLGLLFLR